MKRLIPILSGLLALAACDARVMPAPAAKARNPDGWVRAPVATGVVRQLPVIIFSGQAEPGARVVLRGPAGTAYASSADDQGRFDMRLVPPAGASLFSLQSQEGQSAMPSPNRLLVLDGGRGPIAALRLGAASRRLDVSQAGLWSIDSDGASVLVAGLAATPSARVVVGAGEDAVTVTAGPDRVWTTPAPRGGPIQFAGKVYAWPGHMTGAGFDAARSGAGWRVSWSGEQGARQTTWLPDAPGGTP